MWAGTGLPRHLSLGDPERPPQLYEFFVDSFWFESAGLDCEVINAPLKGQQRADIAIVGGGYAGMSTAYNLIQRFPRKRIVLLEGAACGYGASGRNGGFADVGMPGLHTVFEEAGPEAARAYYDATLLGRPAPKRRGPTTTPRCWAPTRSANSWSATASTATSSRTAASTWPPTNPSWRPSRPSSSATRPWGWMPS
jgi:2-polyprenyl-6-methoxyphenol hydroxylase-like FAD-dependent oxidoreductase